MPSKEIAIIIGSAAVSPATAIDTRINLGIEIKQLTEEKVQLERSIPRLEAELNEARYELNEYRDYLAGRYAS